MKYRIAAWLLLSTLAGLWLAASEATLPRARARLQDKKEKKDKGPPAKVDINKLALEVIALRGLQEFDPTLEQLKGLQGMYKADFVTKMEPPPAKASANYVKNLRMLRNAYVKNDEDDIEEYSNKVEVLEEEEEPTVVSEVRPSGAAAIAAREVLRLFTARQVLDVLNAYEDDLPEPVAALLDALEDGIESKGEDWVKERRDAAYKASWLGFGLANNRSIAARKEAAKWLDEKHSLSKAELTRQRDKLEAEVREKIFERVNPAQVIKNIAEHDMAVILANPELPAVLTKRIRAVVNSQRAEKK